MNIGKLIRWNRLFGHPSGKFCSVAVDHFIGYETGLPDGIRQIKPNAQHRRGSGRTAYTQASRSGAWRRKEPFIGWLPVNRNPNVLFPNGRWQVRLDVEYKIDDAWDSIRKSDC
jgi:hypothetical protein